MPANLAAAGVASSWPNFHVQARRATNYNNRQGIRDLARLSRRGPFYDNFGVPLEACSELRGASQDLLDTVSALQRRSRNLLLSKGPCHLQLGFNPADSRAAVCTKRDVKSAPYSRRKACVDVRFRPSSEALSRLGARFCSFSLRIGAVVWAVRRSATRPASVSPPRSAHRNGPNRQASTLGTRLSFQFQPV